MDWIAYKALCDSPHTFSRWILEQSIELLTGEARLAARLGTVLHGTPLEKPADHRAGALTDMFAVTLSVAEARAIERAVVEAFDSGRTTTATQSRGLGGFREVWHEYALYLERNDSAD